MPPIWQAVELDLFLRLHIGLAEGEVSEMAARNSTVGLLWRSGVHYSVCLPVTVR